MKYWLTLVPLVLLGIAKSIGDLAGIETLSGFAAATNASPTMKVFTSHRGYETFSTKFLIEVTSVDGDFHSFELTPAIYQQLKGPYNRRNVYGAALSYGPLLVANEHTTPMFESVTKYALCRKDGLLTEMGLVGAPPRKVVLRYFPRQRKINPLYKQALEVSCES